MSDRIQLLTNQTTSANGATVINNLSRSEQRLSVFGVFNGATVTIETLAVNGTTWIQERDLSRVVVSITADENITIGLPYGISVRAVVASAGGSTDINAVIIRQERRA